MADLIGAGRAVEKFLSLVESSIGTLYRPRAIRNEGRAQADAEAYRLVALAGARKRANLVLSDADSELAERAVARLRHQEMFKQANIESIVDATTKLVEGADITGSADKDWLHYFFESCAIVSDESVQELWSKVLARKVTSETDLSRKMIDCLRWMDRALAKEFVDLAPRIYLFGGSFVQDVELHEPESRNRGTILIKYPSGTEHLAEIGLIKEETAKTFSFHFCSMSIECQELSDRSLRLRGFFDLTHTGRQLTNIVCPGVAEFNRRVDLGGGLGPLLEGYSDLRSELDSLVIPTEQRIKLIVGYLINFLAGIPANVIIHKIYLTGENADTRTILSITKPTHNEMYIECAETRAKELHHVEQMFLKSLLSDLEIYRKNICSME